MEPIYNLNLTEPELNVVATALREYREGILPIVKRNIGKGDFEPVVFQCHSISLRVKAGQAALAQRREEGALDQAQAPVDVVGEGSK